MPEPVAVTCRRVTRAYHSEGVIVEAPLPVDAVFQAGAVNAIVGASGCGKSTLLRLIGGVDRRGSGSIVVGDTDVMSLRGRLLRDYRRTVVTSVAQRPSANLIPHLSLRRHFGRPADADLLEVVGLSGRLDARPHELSGGEQARAALAIALGRRTPLLLLDEPTAELDSAAAGRVIEALDEASRRGTTIVVATHDRELIDAAGTTLDLQAPAGQSAATPRQRRSRSSRSALRVHQLTKRYGAIRAVDEVSFQLGAGELGVILGRSGSGKSTLLMLLGGWLVPDHGTTGVESNAWDNVGYLPQRFGLLPELTVAENVALPARIVDGQDGNAESLLHRLDLHSLTGRLPDETSIGQQQRTALARALARRPSIVLADEPTAHQDGHSAERVWDALLVACDGGTACLVVTHDAAAAAYADRLWEISDGRLQPLT